MIFAPCPAVAPFGERGFRRLAVLRGFAVVEGIVLEVILGAAMKHEP